MRTVPATSVQKKWGSMMNYKTKSKRLALSLALVPILIFSTFTSSALAFGTALETTETINTMDTLQGTSSRSRPSQKTANRTSRDGLSQNEDGEIDPASATNQLYSEIIPQINAGRSLSPQIAVQLLRELKARQSSAGTFKTKTLAQHYILTAWANYFNNDIKRAQQSARLAFKKNTWSKDTQITQTAIAILAGSKPAPLPKERPTARSYSTRSDKKETAPDTFDFDIDRIENALLGFNIKEMNLNCINSTTLEYKHGTSNICILLWKLTSDSPTPSLNADPISSREPNGFEKPAVSISAEDNSSVFIEIDAFKKLFAGSMGKSNTKFVAINMDPAESKQTILAAILENPWPWANVMINDPASNASQFQEIPVEKNKPILLIADKNGTIKYAGPASGFLAPMVISQLSNTGQATPPAANTFTPTPANNGSANGTIKKPVQKPTHRTSQKPVYLTDTPPTEMSMEDEFQAGKLLEHAKMFIKAGSRYMTPKKGIETCRQIISDYPGSKYAQEARMLLREVPERYHKRYGITNEELGL